LRRTSKVSVAPGTCKVLVVGVVVVGAIATSPWFDVVVRCVVSR
jgi:hypothetical protein